MRTRWIEITQRAEYCCCSRFWIPKNQIKIIRVHVFHQINSNVHDNKNINNNDNTNCFTAITRSEKDCLHVIVCVYVCVWVCVTLRKNVFLQISIFLVGGAFAGFFLKKREQSPRARNTNTQPKKTEREFTLPHDPRFFLIPRFTFVVCTMTFKTSTSVYTNWERRECEKEQVFPNALSRSSSSRFAIHSFGFSFQFPKKRGFPLSLVSQFTLNLNLYRTDLTLLVSLSLSVTQNHSNGFRRYTKSSSARRVKK